MGGGSQAYRDFVRDGISREKDILFEKMLGKFYIGSKGVEIPDFVVLRFFGQLMLGIKCMLFWPLFIYHALVEMTRELLTRDEPEKVRMEKALGSGRTASIYAI